MRALAPVRNEGSKYTTFEDTRDDIRKSEQAGE